MKEPISPVFCRSEILSCAKRVMRHVIPIRGWRGAILGALLGIVMSGAALADSPATPTTSSPSSQATPHTTTSSGTASSAATHKSATHASSAHKTSGKSTSHKSTGPKATASRGKKGSKNQRSRKRGQQAIDRDRARAIQEALIREHYLQGVPSGTWDATTQAAMQRYQADQGWQSKTTPDSRALIKLGLGPSNDHLLNPESAMTSAPATGAAKASKPDPAQNNLPHQ
jgi:hypothetical protein